MKKILLFILALIGLLSSCDNNNIGSKVPLETTFILRFSDEKGKNLLDSTKIRGKFSKEMIDTIVKYTNIKATVEPYNISYGLYCDSINPLTKEKENVVCIPTMDIEQVESKRVYTFKFRSKVLFGNWEYHNIVWHLTEIKLRKMITDSCTVDGRSVSEERTLVKTKDCFVRNQTGDTTLVNFIVK